MLVSSTPVNKNNESYENQFDEMLIKGKVLFSDILFLEKRSMNAAFITRKMNE